VKMYPLGDFLIAIKNAYLAEKSQVVVPWSKQKEAVAKLLKKAKFLKEVKVKKEGKKQFLAVELSPEKGRVEVKLFSKPGRRYYVSVREIPFPQGKGAVVIVSTPQGVMLGKEARKKKIGGELIAHIW